VERELPELDRIPAWLDMSDAYEEGKQDMLNNNWRCVESILDKDSPV